MSMPILAEWFVALLLLVTGLSHVLHPLLWAQLFRDLLSKPYAGFYIGVMTLPLGLWVVIVHNTWALSASVLATIIGWGWTIKGTLYLLAPGVPQRVAAPHLDRPKRFVPAGAIGMVIAALIILHRVGWLG